jgi:hypothetical protein
MYTIIGCASILVLLVIIAVFVQIRNIFEAIGSAIAPSIIAAIIGGSVGFAISGMIGDSLPMKEEISTQKLVSVRSATGYSGGFIFGGFGQTSEYHIYVQNSDGSITPHTIDADDTSIFEDPRLKNQGTWVITRKVHDGSGALAPWATYFDWDFGRNSFHVPVGTVVQTFKIQ